MSEPVVLVDPMCLCGRPHPCELHGSDAFPAELDGKLLLRLLDEDDKAIRIRGWDRRRKSTVRPQGIQCQSPSESTG